VKKAWLVGNVSTVFPTSVICLQLYYVKKVYHPATSDNFNNNRLIPVIFGTNISE